MSIPLSLKEIRAGGVFVEAGKSFTVSCHERKDDYPDMINLSLHDRDLSCNIHILRKDAVALAQALLKADEVFAEARRKVQEEKDKSLIIG